MTTPRQPHDYEGQENNNHNNEPDPETKVLYHVNGQSYDPETQIIHEGEGYQDWVESGDYDFTLDNLIDDYKHEFDYNNLPSGHKYGDWVAKSDYDGLYAAMEDISEISQDTISSFYQQYQQLSAHAQEKETAIESLKNQVNQYANQDRASTSYNERRKRELDEREESIESEHKKKKALLYGSLALAALMVLLTVIFFFMWQSAKSDSDSEAQRGTAHQERISELESSLQSNKTELSNAQGQNKELQGKLDSANKRADDAEKAVKDIRKQSDDKDKEIDKLNQDIDKMENDPVTTTVTQTPDNETITSTVTQMAPPEDDSNEPSPVESE